MISGNSCYAPAVMDYAWFKRALTRGTSSTVYILQIDSVRFIAIGAVIPYHMADFVRVNTGQPWPDI